MTTNVSLAARRRFAELRLSCCERLNNVTPRRWLWLAVEHQLRHGRSRTPATVVVAVHARRHVADRATADVHSRRQRVGQSLKMDASWTSPTTQKNSHGPEPAAKHIIRRQTMVTETARAASGRGTRQARQPRQHRRVARGWLPHAADVRRVRTPPQAHGEGYCRKKKRK